MPTTNNPKRQKGEENTTPSATASATRPEEDEDTITTTTQRINKTFDEAKANTRRAVEEAEREITNFVQSFWKSYIDNVLWTPTRRSIENYAATVSNTTDATVAAIRIYNNIVYSNAEAVRLSLEYNRDNAREMSRVFVNTAKQLEKI